MFDAAILLDPTQISGRQAVILRGVFTCGVQAILRDGGTHLPALTVIWTVLREAWRREHRDHGYE